MESATVTTVIHPTQSIGLDLQTPTSQIHPPLPVSSPSPLPPHTMDGTSPCRSHSPNGSSVLSSISATPPPQLDGISTDGPPPKRRKLTSAEKAAKEAEKTQKRAQRATEKQVRDEERRAKNEAIEARKRTREIQKQREEEEKAKKERAQTRIHGFFMKPQGFAKESVPNETLPNLPISVSASPKDGPTSSTYVDPTTLVESSDTHNDYFSTFLPFASPSHATVAPTNRFLWDLEATKLANKEAERWLSDQQHIHQSLTERLELSPLDVCPRGLQPKVTKDIVRCIESTSAYIDVTADARDRSASHASLREQLIMKYICFSTDVRPPYVGTVSQIRFRRDMARLGRNPFRTAHVELDYDYDSEAEWEEPEEGEDINSDNEDDAESEQDPADLEEFLDDKDADEASRSKRKTLYSDMQLLSTGICWEDERNKLEHDCFDYSIHPRQFRMEVICETIDGPIDPFSTLYWPKSMLASTPRSDKAVAEHWRPPLEIRPELSMNTIVPSAAKLAKLSKALRPRRILNGSELERFKQLIEGSDLTKVGLLAVLKKQLPQVSNAVLSDTLSTVAVRVGVKEADKRWKVL